VGISSSGNCAEFAVSINSVEGNCALLNDGTVRCWGKNYHGELGNGTTDFSYTPVRVKELSAVTSISSGSLHYCAIRMDKTVYCWGYNSNGELGNGKNEHSLIPTRVIGISSAVSIDAGLSHNCAVLQNGTIKCWGRNSRGQLGDGTTTNSLAPVEVRGIGNAVAVAIGTRHTCAILRNRMVMGWGLNERGELGDGTGKDSLIPIFVQDLTAVVELGAGDGHTCALRENHTIWCWGHNYAGQLGNATYHWALRPVKVKGITNGQSVKGGGLAHTCALLQDETVWCWGINSTGQLGAPPKPDSPIPVKVIGIPAARSISLNYLDACAITAEQSLMCWGGIHQYKPDLGKDYLRPCNIVLIRYRSLTFVGVKKLSKGVKLIS